MAPVKIKYVVSFTSEDPKHPVENLLLEEGPQPWLCCLRDRSRQLKAELQLEQVCLIGYIDIGNCGSAFLQIEVGRSSWPQGQSYCTLLPTTALMMPAEAKLGKNRSGVRMFKEGDFLASALGEKWDRVRLTCSQPFCRHAQFGLAFIRIRTRLDPEDSRADAAASSQAPPELTSNPWLSHAAISRTYFPETSPSSEEEVALRTQLQQLDPASSPGAQSPACMSRPARMVLKAACARKRAFPLAADTSPLAAKGKEWRQARGASPGPFPSRSNQELPIRRERMKASRRRRTDSNAERSLAVSSVRPRNGSRSERRAEGQKGRLRDVEEEEDRPWERNAGFSMCPICAGRFPTSLLPAHAAHCGEADLEASPTSSSSSWDEPTEAWVPCPICQFCYPAANVERHASTCGE